MKVLTSFTFLFAVSVCVLSMASVASVANGQVLTPIRPTTQSEYTSGSSDARVGTVYNLASQKLAAFRHDDFQTYASLTHPKVLEEQGGFEAFINLTRQAKSTLTVQANGFDALVQRPKRIIETPTEQFAVVIQNVSIRLKSKEEFTRASYLLAISSDAGRSWKLIDGGLGAAKIRELFPSFPANERLPDEIN